MSLSEVKTYFKYLGYSILIGGSAFGIVGGLGTWLGPWAAIVGFLAVIGTGTGYYFYQDRKKFGNHK